MAGKGQITSEGASSGSHATYRTRTSSRTPQRALPVKRIEDHSAFIQACDWLYIEATLTFFFLFFFFFFISVLLFLIYIFFHNTCLTSNNTTFYPDHRMGQHWVAIYIDANSRGEYYDPTGRPPFLRAYVNFMNKHCTSWTYNTVRVQEEGSTVC
jgi:hypothetical protein